MRVNEKLNLKNVEKDISLYIKKSNNLSTLFTNLDNLSLNSLQDLSFNSDFSFFKEINFILSVITSIINKPHISNKSEELILRADQISSLQNDMFLKTIKESKLWKHKKDKTLAPTDVYFNQSVDQLNIIENKFIVMLIDLLDSEMNSYNEFYSKYVLVYDGNDKLSTSEDSVNLSLKEIGRILKRINRIKHTYFYKEISKEGKIVLKHIAPTNILLKDRLYNFCYKFYKSFIVYDFDESINNDIGLYYLMMLLKKLKQLGFKLKVKEEILLNNKNDLLNCNKLSLTNKTFNVSISYDKLNNSIKLIINNKAYKNIDSINYLLFDNNPNFNKLSLDLKNYDFNDNDNVEAISLINRCYIYDNNIYIIKANPKSEEKLIEEFLDDKMKLITVARKIYSQLCPICKEKEVTLNEDSNVYECKHCKSSYTFDNDSDDDVTMWFIKLRRC